MCPCVSRVCLAHFDLRHRDPKGIAGLLKIDVRPVQQDWRTLIGFDRLSQTPPLFKSEDLQGRSIQLQRGWMIRPWSFLGQEFPLVGKQLPEAAHWMAHATCCIFAESLPRHKTYGISTGYQRCQTGLRAVEFGKKEQVPGRGENSWYFSHRGNFSMSPENLFIQLISNVIAHR